MSSKLSTTWSTSSAIARNELRRMSRERMLVVFGLALPIVIMILVGSTFGNGSIHLGVVDLDGTARSAALVARLKDKDGITIVEHDRASALRQDVRATALDAGVVVPAGYAEALARGKAEVDVVVDPKSNGLAAALAAVQGAVDQEGVHEGAVQLVAEDGAGATSARRRVDAADEDLAPVAVRNIDAQAHGTRVGTFSYTAPSNLVLFVFINTFAVSTLLAIDRKQGLTRRILGTPNRAGSIVVGLGAAKLSFALVQSAIIVAIGRFLFDVRWGDPVAALVLILVFATLSTAVGLIVGSLVSDADQAQSVGIPLAVTMGMLGGCMWPLSIVPKFMVTIGHVVPQAWAMDAWQTLIFDGGGLRDIAGDLAVLGGATAVLSVLAVRLLRRSVTG